jgi:hypothetical protein
MKALSIPDVLAEVAVLVKPHFGKGRTADYIPQLAGVPGSKFGMAVRTVAGDEHVIGDADEGFSVQSITKVFALGLALNRLGDETWTRVGKEPSGTPFNHLSLLEAEAGRAAQPVHQRRRPGGHRHPDGRPVTRPPWSATSPASSATSGWRSIRPWRRPSWPTPGRTAPSPA